MNEALHSIVSEFGVSVSPADIAPLGNGLINDTFRVTVPDSRSAISSVCFPISRSSWRNRYLIFTIWNFA